MDPVEWAGDGCDPVKEVAAHVSPPSLSLNFILNFIIRFAVMANMMLPAVTVLAAPTGKPRESKMQAVDRKPRGEVPTQEQEERAEADRLADSAV